MSKVLADKIEAYIRTNAPVTYTTLLARAESHGIPSHEFEQAMELLHRRMWVKKATRDDEITYSIAVVAAKPQDTTWYDWCKENYPWPGRNGVPAFVMPFPEWDLHWLVLSPENMLKFKAELRGVAYIPRRRYEHARGKDTT